MKTKILMTFALLATATYAPSASAKVSLPNMEGAVPLTTKALFDCARAKDIIHRSEKNECFYLVNEGEGVTLREFHAKSGICSGADTATSPARAFFELRKTGYRNYIWVDVPGVGESTCDFDVASIIDEL